MIGKRRPPRSMLPRRPPRPEWLRWLIDVQKEGRPGRLSGFDFGALTGQDMRALAAIRGCWELLASCDDDGVRGALAAVRALLPAVQPQCRVLARELIAHSLDWSDREKYWDAVQPFDAELQREIDHLIDTHWTEVRPE